jgi:hypothetical protein
MEDFNGRYIKVEICNLRPIIGCTSIWLSFLKKTAKLLSCYQQSRNTDSLISCLSRHNAAISNKTDHYTRYEVGNTVDMSRRVIDQVLRDSGYNSA